MERTIKQPKGRGQAASGEQKKTYNLRHLKAVYALRKDSCDTRNALQVLSTKIDHLIQRGGVR